MPFKKLTLDAGGKAYWVQPDDTNIAIVNNSTGTITLTDGADIFPIPANTVLHYVTRPGSQIALEGTAGLTVTVFWGPMFFRAFLNTHRFWSATHSDMDLVLPYAPPPTGGEIVIFDMNTLLWTVLANPGAGVVLKHDGVNPNWAGLVSAPQFHNTRRTTVYTNATTTFTDIFTLIHNPNPSPRVFWAYAVARVNAAGTVGELRLFDKSQNAGVGAVLSSPHPDTVYSINGRTVNASDCLIGRDAGTLPIGNHTLALQGRVTVSGTLTVDKAGLYGFRENSFTSG